ncbi:hypothetical protein AC578_9891 [Pseudocercospora eumusae]|uniref:Uncharacterized protein n=1 Tax=Pseudocercospora eumusae TaxID=321146 RepID=A0A139HAY3_9PEZI|nr:hypothetical protein AC578_9891 [Pseudocercospora eumusae]
MPRKMLESAMDNRGVGGTALYSACNIRSTSCVTALAVISMQSHNVGISHRPRPRCPTWPEKEDVVPRVRAESRRELLLCVQSGRTICENQQAENQQRPMPGGVATESW